MDKQPPRAVRREVGVRVTSWICPSEHVCVLDSLIVHQKQNAPLCPYVEPGMGKNGKCDFFFFQ